MKKAIWSVLLASLVMGAGSVRSAGATEMGYVWELDPPPFGPNSSASSSGKVLTLLGGGSVDPHGNSQGHGVFTLTDRSGNVIKQGSWATAGRATVKDEGKLDEEIFEHVVQRGVVTTPITLSGLGQGTLRVYCAAGKRHLEGMRVDIGKVTYRKIVSGSNLLMRTPGA